MSTKTAKQPMKFDPDAHSKYAPPSEPIVPLPPARVGQAKPKEERKQVGARIPEALYRQLKARAALEGELVQELVEQAIRDFLLKDHPVLQGLP
jgi:hypothetical protein